MLKYIADGFTGSEIGDLGASVKTVQTYRARIMDKLHLQIRPELVRYALRKVLISDAT